MTNALADLRRARSILVHRDHGAGQGDDLGMFDSGTSDIGQRLLHQFATRARPRDVLLVDPASFLDDVRRPTIALRRLEPGLYRAIPRLPAVCRGREATIHRIVRALLLELFDSNQELVDRFDAPIQWFCTPMPAPAMIGAFRESAVVYSRRTAFPRDRVSLAYDRFLLDRADIVVTAE